MRRRPLTTLFAAALLLPIAHAGNAQEASPGQAAQIESPALQIVEDELGRGTPRRSLIGFLTATQDRDFETAAQYLDLRNLPRGMANYEGPDLAKRLAIVIEREVWIDPDEISDEHDGVAGDNLPAYRDLIAELESQDETYQLLLQRVPRGDGEFIWKISNRTVAQIPALYKVFGYGPIEERLKEALPDITILNVELFKWVIVLGAAIIAYPILFLLLSTLSRSLVKRDSPIRDRVRRFFTRPFLWLILVLITNYVLYSLGMGIGAQRLADAHTVDIAISAWMLLSGTNLLRDIYRLRLQRQGREGAIVLLGPIGNAIKIVIVILAVLLWLSNLGYNITALLAGLGVGGIAIALALQKPLEDLLGAVTMYAQQPAKIGDFCQIGDISGTIEEISLRSTRIRTLGNTVVSIPNAKIAGDVLNNISARKQIWYHPRLPLRYDATAEQLRRVIAAIKSFLVDHERVAEEQCRVRLTGFGQEGFEIDVHAYICTTDFAEYLEIAEVLNLGIVDIITESGTEFAVPFRGMD